jgi:hypothetical protein
MVALLIDGLRDRHSPARDPASAQQGRRGSNPVNRLPSEAGRLPLLLVFSGKLVGVAQHYLPFAVLPSGVLAAARMDRQDSR